MLVNLRYISLPSSLLKSLTDSTFAQGNMPPPTNSATAVTDAKRLTWKKELWNEKHINSKGVPEKLRKTISIVFACTQADYAVCHSSKELYSTSGQTINHQVTTKTTVTTIATTGQGLYTGRLQCVPFCQGRILGSKLVLRCLHSATIIAIKLSWCDISIFALDQ